MAKVRLQVCNREGECVPMKVKAHQLGQTVSIYSDEVTEFTDALLAADDELWRDNEGAWQDNFDLQKVRNRQQRGE